MNGKNNNKNLSCCAHELGVISHTSSLALGMAKLDCQSTTLGQTEIFHQLWDGLPWNFVQTFMVPKVWMLLTLVIPWLFLQWHHEVDFFFVKCLWRLTEIWYRYCHSRSSIGKMIAIRSLTSNKPGGCTSYKQATTYIECLRLPSTWQGCGPYPNHCRIHPKSGLRTILNLRSWSMHLLWLAKVEAESPKETWQLQWA